MCPGLSVRGKSRSRPTCTRNRPHPPHLPRTPAAARPGPRFPRLLIRIMFGCNFPHATCRQVRDLRLKARNGPRLCFTHGNRITILRQEFAKHLGELHMKNSRYSTQAKLSVPLMGVLVIGWLFPVSAFAAENKIIKNADGSSIETRADGTEIVTNAYHPSIETKADGTKITKNADGSSIETRADRTEIVTNADHSSIETRADGTEIVTNEDGSSIQTNPDGSKIVTNADGTKDIIKAK